MTETSSRLIVSSSPHLRGPDSVPRIMWSVVGALTPAALISIYYFGVRAALTIVVGIIGCLAVEYLFTRLFKKSLYVTDGSAAVTGLLLALNLPGNAPWWMVLIGCVIAIGFGKMVYGGLGHNIFNPALIGRVFLLISFPVQMTTWPVPRPLFGRVITDAVTAATPLGLAKEAILMNKPLASDQIVNWVDLAIGQIGGSMGETSAIALLLGAAFLLYKGYISWQTPVSFIGTVAVMGQIFHWYKPELYPNALFHVLAGGLMLGALFMATDMVTSPLTGRGQLIFGMGCGIFTVVIRLFGGYPEGVSFAILLMNAVVPIIDRYTKPKKFGFVAESAKKVGSPG
ncbi:MAG: RnfABCDGE type electron transport complex subunit D [Myxococcales bacterium]|nr:RnfABCDGE type electron transport complex subunit D [Myxococcales bacterium]